MVRFLIAGSTGAQGAAVNQQFLQYCPRIRCSRSTSWRKGITLGSTGNAQGDEGKKV